MNPKVSVIIPAYNKADYTVKAVESVLNQSYPNIECIVVDDGSTDDTIKKICPKGYIENPQLTIIKNIENKGVSYSRNRGIKEATGEYIAFLDCDDEHMGENIALSIDEMKRQKVTMIYGTAILINQKGHSIGIYRPKRYNLLFKNHIINSVMIKRNIFNEIGLFDENLFICADWDMWLRIEEHFKIGYIDFPLTCYRI